MPYPYNFQGPQTQQAPNAEYPQQSTNRFPYTYGMMQDLPSPMNPPPMGQLPPLYPNMNLPQVSPPNPFGNSNMQQARYAHGGSVKGHHGMQGMHGLDMHSLAEILKSQGQHGDTQLAHVSPEEAQMLSMGHHDINPHTGLPQYFRFGRLLRGILPVLGTVLGSALGGPAGGAVGGAIGGGLGNRRNPLMGAAMGGAGGYLGSSLFGGGSGNILGNIFGSGGGGGAGSGLGRSLMGMIPGISGAMGQGNQGGGQGGEGAGIGGILNSLFGGGNSGLIDKALLGTTLFGALKGKGKQMKEAPVAEQLASAGFPQADKRPLPAPAPLEMKRNPLAAHWDPLANAYTAEQDQYLNPDYSRYYAEGGHATNYDYADGGRYLEGETGGQADKIDAKLSDGEYVIDASTVSDLGDGNNKAGAAVLKHFVENVRKHKRTSDNGLPPKAKPIAHYMKGGR